MGRIGAFLLIVLVLGLSLAEAARPPKPIKLKHAKKCRDQKSKCFHLKSRCPVQCPHTCHIDCNSCETHCDSPSYNNAPPDLYRTRPAPNPSGQKKVRCMDRKHPSCYYKEQTCPEACPRSCEADCVTCSPVCNCDKPGAVCQDSKFIGADGITFHFHGKKDHDFCLVTDDDLHINAHFIGKRYDAMKRDFTCVQSLGILFGHHNLSIAALKTATWNDAVDRLSISFDGLPVPLPERQGASWNSSAAALTITRTVNTNAVVVEVEGNFKITAAVVPITEKESAVHNYGITSDDTFAHLDLNFKFFSLTGGVSGVLGQTYAPDHISRVKMGVSMPVLGGDREFASSSLFSTDCSVARFSGRASDVAKVGI